MLINTRLETQVMNHEHLSRSYRLIKIVILQDHLVRFEPILVPDTFLDNTFPSKIEPKVVGTS